jgi:phosphohistidine phosphatase
MRHAKSDWSNPKQSDIGRALNPRGRKAAFMMGQWLSTHNLVPNYVICSTATRARETLARMRLCGDIPSHIIKYEPAAYDASKEVLLNVLQDCQPDKETVMLIGHNPGLEDLLYYLCGDNLPLSKSGKLLPTASIAVVDTRNGLENQKSTLKEIARTKEL